MSLIIKTLSFSAIILFLGACAGAYSSHHGNRGARYNSIPYTYDGYRYNNFYRGSAYAGRPYRRY
jgi:hypothetical protein